MSDTEWGNFNWRSTLVPQAALSDEERAKLLIPKTLRPIIDPGVTQKSIFEPALKQYGNAYRAADPSFDDEQLSQRWYAARRTAIDVILKAIAEAEYADSLVLRGSVLLRAWYGEAAREPGDLDFVVAPASWKIDEPRTGEMLQSIAHAAGRARTVGNADGDVRIVAQEAVSEDIWTYDRVPGRRLLLPWEAPGLPGGWIQLDFVFNENLAVAPELTLVPASASDGTGATLLAATPELSLAWKIMWLVTDTYPQGKDLYDAVLLAEHTPLRFSVLRDAFVHVYGYLWSPVSAKTIAKLYTEWDHFRSEHPEQPDAQDDYVGRLIAALATTFADFAGSATAEYDLYVAWLAPKIASYRELLARADMHAVQEEMVRDRISPLCIVVVTRELAGRESCSLVDAHRIVVQDPAWTIWFAVWNGDAGLRTSMTTIFGVDFPDGHATALDTRVIRRVRRDFQQFYVTDSVLRKLAELPLGSTDPMLNSERVQAAIVLLVDGDIAKLQNALTLARTDWRDLLLAAGLAEANWPARLDAEFGV